MDFQSWPGLTSNIVHEYLPNSVATLQGHFNQSRKYAIFAQAPITMEPRNAETRVLFATVVDSGKV